MDYQCPVCQGPMRLVPAGVSKRTNKPYSAFYACENYSCKGSRKETGEPKVAYVNKPYTPQQAVESNIERNIKHKDEGIRFFAIRRDAVATAIAFKTEGWTEEIFKEAVDYWINFYETTIYQDKPF